MGLLTALAIVCAFIADFLLLPALLIAFDRREFGTSTADDSPEPGLVQDSDLNPAFLMDNTSNIVATKGAQS